MSGFKERRLVIVGGGTAGWMTAAALARFCSPAVSVTLVESDEIGIVGVGEATIPPILAFNKALGIDEGQFLAATGATYKLGIAFEGWGKPDEAYLHSFGLVGQARGILPFHHHWLRGRSLGFAKPLGHYLLNTMAIAGNRFARIERPAGSPLPPLPYAFHFDAALYAQFLRKFAEGKGAVRHEGRIIAVERNQSNGDITAVLLANGTRIEGDLFVDCSGFRGLLIEQELEAGYDDWSHWLPCDRAVAVASERVDPLVPYTRSIARSAGWQWRIPLQHRTGNGHVFSSRFKREDQATQELLENLDGPAVADPRVVRFTTGRRRKCWVRNVVAIGLSAGFIEPLESTSIHLIQTAINRLLDLLPAGEIAEATRAEYNRKTASEIERIRDFIILHYHANGRLGEPFWDELRSMTIPETLSARIELFRSSARVLPDADELFDVRGWVQVMIGQNIEPESWHPAAERMTQAKLRDFLDGLEKALVADVSRMAEHGQFVARFGPMKQKEQVL